MYAPSYAGSTPMFPVTNVALAIEFYHKLGFQTGNSHTPEGADKPVWAWLHSGKAHVMVNQSDHPIEATHHGVSLWLYIADVKAAHESLRTLGMDVSDIDYPFYNPGGEFHVHDPDGYAIFITHAGQDV
jgi:catechol 2,3-dioxygenase-like lactoylglutathione lyase family enzyme